MVRRRETSEFSHLPTPCEARVIQELKRNADECGRGRWKLKKYSRWTDNADFDFVSRALDTDFVDKVVDLSRRFRKRKIEVLFEGSGVSRFPEELVERCRKRGIGVRVFRTDLYSPKAFKELAIQHGLDAKHYRQATPEELVRKFGRNSFHLIVSRTGGLTYTPLPQVKGVHNVCKVLKPGGEAHILTENIDRPSLPLGNEIRLRSPVAGKLTAVGAFFKAHPQFAVEEKEHEIGAGFLARTHPILRIKRIC
ncbi:MAG: class I SAM-dependent methyltransferase [Candidatus Micrarchaeota archaeon]